MIINLLISIVIFALIIWYIGYEQIVEALSKANLAFIGAAIVLYIILNIIMSFRIKIILEKLGNKLNVLDIAPSSLAGLLASDFTPARVGYFFSAFSLSSKFNIEIEKTIMSIFGPQLFDFLIKIVSAAILIIWLTKGAGVVSYLIIAIAFLGIIFVSLLLFYPPLLDWLKIFNFIPFFEKGINLIKKMQIHSEIILSVKFKIIAITLCSWFVKGIEWLFLAKSLGINLSSNIFEEIFIMLIFQAAITIVQFIPLPTVAGAGASEAAFASVLYFFGVSAEKAIVFGFLTRLVMLTIDLFSLPILIEYLNKHNFENTLGELNNIKK